MKNHWTPNAGGVCDECGEPRFAHTASSEACPSQADCDRLHGPLTAWHAAVQPIRDAYRHAREAAKKMAASARKGKPHATPQAVEAATVARDQLLVDYRAAIRRADRDAEEILRLEG